MSDVQTPNLGPGPTGNPKADAKAAKAYAKASRPWYMKKRWWLAGLVLVIIAVSAAGGGGGDGTDEDSTATDNSSSQSTDTGKKKKAASSQEESEPEPAAKPMKVPAAAILKEFEGNEAAADIKYNGKTLQVTGEVSKVDTEMFEDSEYVIQINGGGDFEFTNVNCNDQAAGDVAKIQIGQQITVVGEFDDGGDLGVELKDCKVA